MARASDALLALIELDAAEATTARARAALTRAALRRRSSVRIAAAPRRAAMLLPLSCRAHRCAHARSPPFFSLTLRSHAALRRRRC